MTGPRTPLVAGIEPGAGASTLAAALHAEDAGVLAQQADVVVCRPTPAALRAVAAVACPGRGPHPVLVVTGPVPGALPAAIRTRFAAVVELPLVEAWVRAPAPAGAAADVLAAPHPLPAALLPYAEALREVVAALIRSGQLDASTPPMAIRPRTADPWRGTRSPSRPVSRHRLVQPVRPAGPAEKDDDEDDEAIELRNQLAAGRAR